MPHNKNVLKWIKDASLLLKADPHSWLLASLAYLLFIWTQDTIPFFGFIVSSCFTTFVIARIFSSAWRQKYSHLLGLGCLNFPSFILISQASSYLQLGSLPGRDPAIISFVLFFTTTLWLLVFYWAVAESVNTTKTVNQALSQAWRYFQNNYKLAVIYSALIASFIVLSIILWGIGLIAIVPLALAIVRSSYDGFLKN